MKNNISKLFLTFSLLTTSFIYAIPAPVPDGPGSGNGGTGGTGTGGPANPIDMYVYVLAIIAFILIAFYSKKFKTKQAL